MEPGETTKREAVLSKRRDFFLRFLIVFFYAVLWLSLTGSWSRGHEQAERDAMEKRIILVTLHVCCGAFALSALAINLFHVGLLTCVTT